MKMSFFMRLGSLALVFATAIFCLIVTAEAADNEVNFGRKIEGTFILDQNHESARSSYLFTEFGSVIWSSSDQKKYSYAPANGIWEQMDERKARVKIVSFDFDSNGLAIVHMNFQFDEEFNKVSGSFDGAIYPMDVDVNNINKKPMQKFSGPFTGVRLSMEK